MADDLVDGREWEFLAALRRAFWSTYGTGLGGWASVGASSFGLGNLAI